MKIFSLVVLVILSAGSSIGSARESMSEDKLNRLREKLQASPFKDADYYCVTEYAHIALYQGRGDYETYEPKEILEQKGNELVILEGDRKVSYKNNLLMAEDGAGQLSAQLIFVSHLKEVFSSAFSLYYEHEGAYLAGTYALPEDQKNDVEGEFRHSSDFAEAVKLDQFNNICGPYSYF